eukprot:TRINITY_DN45435_c0_g1_i3.p1 TRINITY_DN45435_c0_g1~~TRINITY_DN45435_c0_g1_i3.p1  ORF type:complete len:635 (-),score=132.94 TRINITY_DN45435_c0_g1_i3:515-2419(-)
MCVFRFLNDSSMSFTFLLFTALLAGRFAVICAAGLFPQNGRVVPGEVFDFTPKDLNETVLPDKVLWVVDYYAAWCPHCQHFVPTWQSIAKVFKEEPRVRFGALNCPSHGEFCRELQIRGFPTLRAYHLPGSSGDTKHGVDVVAKGGRSEEGLTAYIKDLLHRDNLLAAATNGSESGKTYYVLWSEAPEQFKHESFQGLADGLKRFAALDGGPWAAILVDETLKDVEYYGSVSKDDFRRYWETLHQSAPVEAVAPVVGVSGSASAGHAVGMSDAAVANAAEEQQRQAEQPRQPQQEQQPQQQNLRSALVAARAAAEAEREDTATPAARLHDAKVALLTSLHGAILGEDLLSGTALDELVSWLDFVKAVFPNAEVREDVKMQSAIASGGGGNNVRRSTWEELLQTASIGGVHAAAATEPALYLEVCRDYACSLWMLFHVLSAAAASLAEGQFDGSGVQSLWRLRGFVQHFVKCPDCDCIALLDDAISRCRSGVCNARGAAVAVWRFHGAVAAALARKKSTDEVGGQSPSAWPSLMQCPDCRIGSDDWNEAEVASQVVAAYVGAGGEDFAGRFPDHAARARSLLAAERGDADAELNQLMIPAIALAMTAVLLAIGVLRRWCKRDTKMSELAHHRHHA